MRPRVGMNTAAATQSGKEGAVHDTKFESELIAHFLLPLHLD